MKNVIGAIAPNQNAVVKLKFLIITVLLSIGFVSCDNFAEDDLTNRKKRNEISARCTCVQANGEIGGCKGIKNECAIGIGRTTSDSTEIGGGRSSMGQLNRTSKDSSEIGGKQTVNTGNYTHRDSSEIGGSRDPIIIRYTGRDSTDIGGGGVKGSTTVLKQSLKRKL